MDLRGFPQINTMGMSNMMGMSKMMPVPHMMGGVNDVMKMTENMLLSEMISRNYVGKSKLESYSLNVTINAAIDIIKNNNVGLNDFLKNNDVTICDDNGLTLLKIAVMNSNIDALKMILVHMSYTLNNNDIDILSYACANSDYTSDTEIVISELLKCSNIDGNKSGGYQREIPLYYVINKDNTLNIINLLLASGKVNVNSLLNTGRTLLHYAISNRKYKVATRLIESDDIILNRNDLDLIFELGTIEVMNHLINVKKYKIIDDEYFLTLIKRNDIPIELCSCYTNINYQDITGKSALMYAAEMSDINKLNFLLSNPNIDLSLLDNNNVNALLFAIMNRNYVCVKMLVNHIKNSQAIINQKNEFLETPLIIAVKNHENSIFKLLYDTHLCDINIIDTERHSALYYAIENANMEIFDWLYSDPAIDIGISDLEGNTSLFHAVKKSNTNMIYKLLSLNSLNLNAINNCNQNILNYVLYKKYYETKNTIPLSGGGSDEYASYPDCYNALMSEKSYGISMNEITSKAIDNDNKLVTFLIKKNIELNSFDVYDKSILMHVIDNKDKLVFNALLSSQNLDVNAQNDEGETYLMYLFKKIDKTQNNINKMNNSDDTHGYFIPQGYSKSLSSSLMQPMMNSIKSPLGIDKSSKLDNDQNAFLIFFMQLLDHPKMNINACDYTNATLLSYVADYTHINLLSKILKCKDINVNIQNNIGITPLMTLINKNSWNNAKLLISCGANLNLVDNKGRRAKDYLDELSVNIYNKLFELDTNNKVSLTDNFVPNIDIVQNTVPKSNIIRTSKTNPHQMIDHPDRQTKGWFF